MTDWTKHNTRFLHLVLERLKGDCDYYLGFGKRNRKVLLWEDELKQIQNMKDAWNALDESDKPEWLTWEQILEYENKLTSRDKQGV